MTTFSAGPQALGYLHQIRYALVRLLFDEEAELRLEALDDIEIVRVDGRVDLYQLKHHSPGDALTDASPDFWKTIRVWSAQLADGKLDLDRAILSLVTTATATPQSAPSLLRPGSSRNTGKALALLETTAATSRNKTLAPAFAAFTTLTPQQRTQLLSRVYVLDTHPSIHDSRQLLESRIEVAVPRQHRVGLADRIEGWWFNRCVELLGNKIPVITGFELFALVTETARQFGPDALPIDFFSSGPSAQEAKTLLTRQFVEQLKYISVSPPRIEKAVGDYYRAFAQRGQWAREDLLIGGEVELYDERLRDEWERMRLILEEDIGDTESVDVALQKLGRALLKWMETQADFRIRPAVSEPYVMRGSYHMLADLSPPRVWWHPRFIEQLRRVVGDAPAGEKT